MLFVVSCIIFEVQVNTKKLLPRQQSTVVVCKDTAFAVNFKKIK